MDRQARGAAKQPEARGSARHPPSQPAPPRRIPLPPSGLHSIPARPRPLPSAIPTHGHPDPFLKLLPGGDGPGCWHWSLYDLDPGATIIALAAAGALWQFASNHHVDFLRGNHNPALSKWTRLLNYLRSICKWRLRVFFDGRENPHKEPENARRREAAKTARARGDLSRTIKNTPEYIKKAFAVCEFLGIEAIVASYEADPEVTAAALSQQCLAVTGDSDLLAYGPIGEGAPKLGQLVIMKSWSLETFRIIDLGADVEKGKLPLFDLFREHGRIVFQLYAGCCGCDFTEHPRGIPGIGHAKFLSVAGNASRPLTAHSLAGALWSEYESILQKAGYESVNSVCAHLQRIVDIYSCGTVYDSDENVREFCAADHSSIRGVCLPEGKTAEQCTVAQLRDYIAARGGKITMNKPELIRTSKQYSFIENEVPKQYVDRHRHSSGMLFDKVDASVTRPISAILTDLHSSASRHNDEQSGFIAEAYHLFRDGMFDDKYDNIARVAPELKPALIYKT